MPAGKRPPAVKESTSFVLRLKHEAKQDRSTK
jgi:hypothetical protein